jgi:hypothetical protein
VEELIPKVLETGVLGAINILLIWKGVPAMNKLSESNTQLAAAIGKLTDSVNNRLDIVEHDLRDIKNSLDLILRRLDLYEKSSNY